MEDCKKIKVLHVVSVSFSLTYFVGNQFDYFREQGCDFTVACTPSQQLFEYADEKGFKVFPVNILRSINPLEDFKSLIKLTKLMKKENFDIVIGHSPKGGLLGMIASYFAGVPRRIFFRHGLVFETSKGMKKRMLITIEKITSFFSTKIINVSPSLQRQAITMGLDDASKSFTLGRGACNGVDVSKFIYRKIYREDLVVGFVGRLCIDKGIIDLINAWDIVLKKNPLCSLRLLLVGPNDERVPLPGEVTEKIENTKSIQWIGNVKDTSPYYNLMDIFILPSYREGFGMVNIEAAASSLPVITSNRVGMQDSIENGVTGMYTENNPEGIAKIIQRYIDEPSMRISHGKNGREFVEKYFSESVKNDELKNIVYEF